MNFAELDNPISGGCYICKLPGSKKHNFTISVDNSEHKSTWTMNSQDIVCTNCFHKRLENTMEGLLLSK